MGLLEALNAPGRREEARRQQEELRAKYGSRLAQHPAQANYLYGLAREQQALDQLGALPAGVASEDARRIFSQLAEGLALQGRFEEAAKVTESRPHRAEYLAKADALRQVGVSCQCPSTITTPSRTDAKGIVSSARQVIEKVWDGKAEVTISKCLLCGKLSATIG